MKHTQTVLSLILSTALFFSCSSDPQSNGENIETPISAEKSTAPGSKEAFVLKEPPQLTVKAESESITALNGTTTWHYDNGDGTSTAFSSDSFHPLDKNAEKYTPILKLNEDENAVSLDFPIFPDSLKLVCWKESRRGNTDSPSKEVKVASHTFTPMHGTYIYEVTATWSKEAIFGGTARYSFIIEY